MSAKAELLKADNALVMAIDREDNAAYRQELESVRTVMHEQQAKLEAVWKLMEAAWEGELYMLPGGYPSRPVEAFDLRKALEGKS